MAQSKTCKFLAIGQAQFRILPSSCLFFGVLLQSVPHRYSLVKSAKGQIISLSVDSYVSLLYLCIKFMEMFYIISVPCSDDGGVCDLGLDWKFDRQPATHLSSW